MILLILYSCVYLVCAGAASGKGYFLAILRTLQFVAPGEGRVFPAHKRFTTSNFSTTVEVTLTLGATNTAKKKRHYCRKHWGKL
jgi:hypothetical protein